MPNLLTMKEEPIFVVKYIGSLYVLNDFGCSLHAKAFLENTNRWKDHLKWVNFRNMETHFERVAWI